MNVPGNRIYITRSLEGDGVMESRDLSSETFRDRKGLAIAERLAKAAHFRLRMPEPKSPPPRQRQKRPRRMYVPVNEDGATTQFEICDRTTAQALARCYGSPFYVAKEAILLCKSQGVSDKDFFLRPV